MPLHPYRFDDLALRDDLALVRLAQSSLAEGDTGRETAKRCVGLVVLRHRDLVRSVIAAKVPPGAIDDVESDVWLRFSRKAYSGDEITNPVGLLLRRADYCRPDFHATRPATVPTLGDWDASDDPALDDIVVTAAVADLLAPLGDRQRDVVWQRIIEGRSSAEVAAMLETTAGNIDVIVHRALATMREAQS
ncbi:MAG: sigma-70 family RNA polymerase sigma factor [Candidatus Dormibacteria bacterium]